MNAMYEKGVAGCLKKEYSTNKNGCKANGRVPYSA